MSVNQMPAPRRPWSEPMPLRVERAILYLLLPCAGIVAAWVVAVVLMVGT